MRKCWEDEATERGGNGATVASHEDRRATIVTLKAKTEQEGKSSNTVLFMHKNSHTS